MLEQATFTFKLDQTTFWTVNGYSRRFTYVEICLDRDALTSVILHGIGSTKHTVPFNQLTDELTPYIKKAQEKFDYEADDRGFGFRHQ